MNKSEMVLKALLSRCTPEKRSQLERFLPEGERLRLEQLPSFELEAPSEQVALLDRVHWSWLLPILKTYSERDQKLLLASLSPQSAQNLAHELKIFDGVEISEVGKSFLQRFLLDRLIGSEQQLLPTDYLPASPLNPLLHLSKKELTKLIDDLSLYDLAAEMRQIVETKILKKIYSLLSEEERKFIKQIASHKETFQLPRMGMERWDGDEETFRHLLHKRGLARFAIALSGQDPDFVWLVCHELDIGRGTSLLKLSKEGGHGVADAIVKQIEEWLKNV